jgi:putative peptide zinc metalloprotease protein
VAADETLAVAHDDPDATRPGAPAASLRDAVGDAGDDGAELAPGVELLGEYEGSGYREAPYLIRRRDGQVMQVSHLIYLIAGALGPGVTFARVAEQVSVAFGREVSAANVSYLVDERLRPLGVLRGAGDDSSAFERANPLLGLRLRLPLVPERIHGPLTRACRPLFRPLPVVAALAGLVALDAWLVLAQWGQLASGVRQVIYQPQLMLLITALTIVAGAFHETGHATAARYGGARPGAMGAGIYLVWPVFYTDVTDAYRLSRAGRLRVDLGGVYFNVVSTLAAAGAYQATGFRPLLVFVVLLQVETLVQFLPFVRLDGYYVVSDLAEVPNLFAYLGPTLVRLVRRSDGPARRAAVHRLDELTRRARVLIGLWVAVTVPVLLVNAVLLVVMLPRFAGAALGSAGLQAEAVAGGSGLDLWGRLNGVVGLVLLALPLAGILYVAGRLGSRLQRALAAWWHTRPGLTATVTATVALVLLLQIGIFWPDTFVSALHGAQEAHRIGQLTDGYGGSHAEEALSLATLEPFRELPAEGDEQATVDAPLAIDPPAEPAGAPGSGSGSDSSDKSDLSSESSSSGKAGDDGLAAGSSPPSGLPGHPTGGHPSDRSVDDEVPPGDPSGPADTSSGTPGSAPPTGAPTTAPPGPTAPSAPTTGPTTTLAPPPPGTGPSGPSSPPPTTAPRPGGQLLQQLLGALFPGL